MAAHIVDYEKWCPKCKYFDSSEAMDPCHHCLGEPVAEDSRKPVDFKEDKSIRTKKD